MNLNEAKQKFSELLLNTKAESREDLINFLKNSEEIDDFIHEQENNNYSSRFLIQEQHINDIYFTATISVFHSINTLYFLFKEENIERNQKNKYAQTRKKHKHFIQKSNKYTRHKKYKI